MTDKTCKREQYKTDRMFVWVIILAYIVFMDSVYVQNNNRLDIKGLLISLNS